MFKRVLLPIVVLISGLPAHAQQGVAPALETGASGPARIVSPLAPVLMARPYSAPLSMVAPARAEDSSDTSGCPGDGKLYNTEFVAGGGLKDEKIRGPRRVRIYFNALRYRLVAGSAVTMTKPDLGGLPFLPSRAGGSDDAAGAGLPGPSISASASASELEKDIATAADAINRLQKEIAVRAGILSDLTAELEETVIGVRVAGSGDVAGAIGTARKLATSLGTAKDSGWPSDTADSVDRQLVILRQKLARARQDDTTNANKTVLDTLTEQIVGLEKRFAAITGDADTKKRFADTQSTLARWEKRLAALKEENFVICAMGGDCGFSFGQTKDTKVTVTYDDLLTSEVEKLTQEIISVQCTSPLSVSVGIGFSALKEQEFGFVQSTALLPDEEGNLTEQVVNRFGFKNRSDFRVLPLILLNTRIKEWPDKWSLHASFGGGVDIKTGEAGTDLEFVAGPSISLYRTLFITPGVHIGRVPKLVGGFNIGDIVPEGVDEPPLEKEWKTGFTVALSYQLP
jgi:hypothetical protein